MKSYFKNIFSITLLSTVLIACNAQSTIEQNVIISTEFDISKNDRDILFACYVKKNDGVSIYKMNLLDSIPELIIKNDEKYSYYNPKYSETEEKIVFIKYNKKNMNEQYICICDVDGKNIKILSKEDGLISGLRFSDIYSGKVIILKAMKSEKSSLIGMNQAHGMDVYYMDSETGKTKKVTNFNAYSIDIVSEIDSSVFLLGMHGGDDGGIFFYDKLANKLKRFVPINNPRAKPSLYYMPKYSKKFNYMGFICPYELYTMDMETKEAVKVHSYSRDQIDSFSFLHNSKKIIFLRSGDNFFLTVDLDGKNLKRINVVL